MPADFKQVVTKQTNVAAKGLQDSMTGMDVSPPDVTPYDADVNTAMGRLNEILGEMPDIDYGQKYLDLQKEIENRPVPENPLSTPGGAAANFAFALGAPLRAPAITRDKIMLSQAEEARKTKDMESLKEKIIEGTIQQEISKGNFKAALKQTDVLEGIQKAKADRERYLNLEEWKTKQRIKTVDASTLLKEKVTQTIASFHLPEKLKLQVFSAATKLLDERMRQRDLLGMPVEDIPSEEIISEILPQIEDMARSLASNKPLGEGKETPPPAAPPVSPYAKALEEIRKGKK